MKVGVIGTGSMGENHVRTYTSLSGYCQLVGIYDSNKNRGLEVANKYQIKQFESITELLQLVDVVSIAVPTEYHYEIGLACIQHKVHMLMEKPIARTVAEAKTLIKKANEAGVKIQVGHIELYNPMINVLKNILINEQVIAIDVHRMNPYDPRVLKIDVVHDLMIHDMYILNELLNDEIIDFYAMGKTIDGTNKHAIVGTKFSNGIIAQLTASFKSAEKIRTINIVTEKGLIKGDLLNKKIDIIRSPECYMKLEKNYTPHSIIESIEFSYNEPLKLQLIDFINCVKNDTTPLVTGQDGLKALTICNKISEFMNNLSNYSKN
ncbi:Gfo/Idh/MocA family protein [Priestia megaterium]|uniref:Gfo/Idh/MocA family protein n=1 Tax=Priestia megaterium TaxID=1404 RepID=UPI002795DE07|nr:Gfo/Idh/MocA family oxidoreductase [Priestia megaterium]